MRALIFGASGLLGRALCQYLDQQRVQYLGTYLSRPVPQSVPLNTVDPESVYRIIENYQPTVCVNCVVQRQLETCEEDWEATKQQNIDSAANIARACQRLRVHMIHISTDYVFDGQTPPYSPDSQTDPLQNYGISKMISEMRVRALCDHYTIIRIPVLFWEGAKSLSESAVTLIGKRVLDMTGGEDIKATEDNYSIRRPVYIPDLCPFLLDCMRGDGQDKATRHFGRRERETFTKYGIAQRIATYLDRPFRIQPVNEPPGGAMRPRDTQLIDPSLDVSQYPETPFQTALEYCFQPLWHPSIYEADARDRLFFLLDLDGTLLDTDEHHFDSYRRALATEGIDLTREEYRQIQRDTGIDHWIQQKTSKTKYKEIKAKKRQLFLDPEQYPVHFVKGAEWFLSFLLDHQIPFCIVTNTSWSTVEYYRQQQPLLKRIGNWITREDYEYPKPSSECYKLALRVYGSGGIEEMRAKGIHIVGIENTIIGYQALSGVTSCIYLFTGRTDPEYNEMKREDVYLFDDYQNALQRK